MELFFSSSPPPQIIISVYFLVSLFFIPYYASSLTFNFTNISPQNQDLIIPGGNGAYISNEGIQLTPDGLRSYRTGGAGRATYAKPLHLWNNASQELASFTTHFTFVIDSYNETNYGDGLVFFLAGNNSVITGGAAMGLPLNATNLVPISPFVAVEFDTYPNKQWDPIDTWSSEAVHFGTHVGIDINNITSVSFRNWWINVTSGGECQASITYDSVTKNLHVVYTDFRYDDVNGELVGFNHTVDLRNELPEWVIFGFAAATGASLELHTVKSWSFNSSDLQSDEKVEKGDVLKKKGSTETSTHSPAMAPGMYPVLKRKGRTGYMPGAIAGLCVLVTVLAVVAFVLCKKKKKSRASFAGEEHDFDVEMTNEFEKGTGPKRFSYQELARSTGGFVEEKKLGEGGFGGVYRGFLKDLSTDVAIKRVSKSSKQGIKEYASEVRIISRLRHKNLVQLIGWCHEKKELLLVYELMENGSLDMHLFKEKSLLTWEVRYKIARGLASALLYLHEDWEQCVLHRDIKSSNIMLDSNFNAKLGDFGLAKFVEHEKGSQTTTLAGTMGYMAPECYVEGKASRESDVFSFGVVALEIACGRKPIDFEAPQIRLVEWVWELYGNNKLLEAADPRLDSDFKEEEIKRLMIVGLWCADPDKSHRPSMKQAIQVLNFEADLPSLPSVMPATTFIATRTAASYGICTIAESIRNQSSSSGYNTESSKMTASSAGSTSQAVALLHSR